MATANKAAEKAAQTTAAPAVAEKPLKLKVLKSGIKFKGARDAWWIALTKMDGKPKDEVLKALEEKRPSVYGPKSKHAGKPEPVAGWVRFYERNGYIAFTA